MHLPEFDTCPMHLARQALDASKFSACVLDLSYFPRKSKCALKPLIKASFSNLHGEILV